MEVISMMKPYTIRDFKVGDKVVLADCRCRAWGNEILRDVCVVTVGKSIIYIANAMDGPVIGRYKVDAVNGYGLVATDSNNRIFLTNQDYQDYCNYLKTKQQFHRTISDASLSLSFEQMIQILDIINEGRK